METINQEFILADPHTSKDLLEGMQLASIEGKNNDWVQEVAYLASKIDNVSEQLAFILEEVYQLAIFRLTPDNRQQLKTVNNIVRNNEANCTQYSIILSSILLVLGRPHMFRLVDQDNKGYGHVYVICEGYTLDAALGHKQNNQDTFDNRKNNSTFDYEVSYLNKKDHPMLTIVNGNRARQARHKMRMVNSVSTCIDTCIQQGGDANSCYSYCSDPVEQQTSGGGFNFNQYTQFIPYISNHVCRRECDFQYINDPDGRLRCKEACPQIQTQQGQFYPGYFPQRRQDNTLLLVGVAAAFLLLRKKK